MGNRTTMFPNDNDANRFDTAGRIQRIFEKVTLILQKMILLIRAAFKKHNNFACPAIYT